MEWAGTPQPILEAALAHRTARSYTLAQAVDTLLKLGLRATGLRRKHVVALVHEWKRQGRSIGTMKNRTTHIR